MPAQDRRRRGDRLLSPRPRGRARYTEAKIQAKVDGGKLTGVKVPVTDGDIADLAVVLAKEGGRSGLFLVDLTGAGVTRETLQTLDPTRGVAKLTFAGARGRAAGRGGRGRWRWPRRCWTARRCCWRSSRWAAPTAAWRWPRLRARALRLRPADRQLPGDQAQAGRHLRQERARPLQRLLRRLGAGRPARPSCRWPPRPRVSRPPRPSGSPPRRTSRPTAAWASPGRSTATSIYRRSRQLGLVAGGAQGLEGAAGAPARTAQRRLEGEATVMDFNDTPEEAAYRAKARAWLEANAPKFARATAATARIRRRGRLGGHEARQGLAGARRPRPATPASPGRRSGAGAAARRCSR